MFQHFIFFRSSWAKKCDGRGLGRQLHPPPSPLRLRAGGGAVWNRHTSRFIRIVYIIVSSF